MSTRPLDENAWDIETVPLPQSAYTDVHTKRLEKNLAREMKHDPSRDEDDARRLVQSVCPLLGWICCLSVRRYDGQNERSNDPRSYTAENPEQERRLLSDFWRDVSMMPAATWITFNGKRFDAPFLLARTYAVGLTPTRWDLLDRHLYRHHPHTDLSHLFKYLGLADVCALLGVESPKQSDLFDAVLDGSQVAPAVQAGRIDRVAEYCERDVTATLDCYHRTKLAHTRLS